MSQTVITEPEQISPEWLTTLLRERGSLEQGHVITVTPTVTDSTVSHIVYLQIEYSTDMQGKASNKLCMKMNKADLPKEQHGLFGKREVQFYNTVREQGYTLPVPYCYDAVYSDEQHRFHILMEDVSPTHAVATEWPLPPPVPQCEMVIDSLAKLHATWWECINFSQDIPLSWKEDKILEKRAWQEKITRDFADFMGDRLSPERLAIYEQAFPFYALMVERVRMCKNLTLTHGDSHLWNYLYPRAGSQDQVLLIDWDGCAIDVGPQDLSYMIALHWFPERRAKWEKKLVRRYYEGLCTHGITGYSWDECWNDYRLTAIGNLIIPVFYWSIGLGSDLWWPHFERSMLAFEDLGCVEFLQR